MVSFKDDFETAFSRLPLVAILRGVTPQQVEGIADVLIKAGFGLIEVPLNSPDAFKSIELLARHCHDDVLIGAGTVLRVEEVAQLAKIGASLMVTPNVNPEIIRAGVSSGLIPIIGCMTPSEALLAQSLGAAVLKIFPAGRMPAGYVSDIKAVLPADTRIIAVGGIGQAEMAGYYSAGYDGFGLGGSLYVPGRTPQEVSAIVSKLCAEWNRLCVTRDG